MALVFRRHLITELAAGNCIGPFMAVTSALSGENMEEARQWEAVYMSYVSKSKQQVFRGALEGNCGAHGNQDS